MNPGRVRIGEDKSLIVVVDGKELMFSDKQYLRSDRGKILLKHAAVMELAEQAGVTVGEPHLLQTHGPMTYVVSRQAVKSFTAVGETNKLNLYDDMMKRFPAETVDNRAYERAVLGVLGLHGELYGASEINYKDSTGGPPPSAALKKDPKKMVEPENTEAPAEEQAAKTSKNSDGNPFWWDDLGMGVYSDKQLDPETHIVTEGPSKGKDWTVKQLYDYNYASCAYFAERTNLDNAAEEFQMQVYSCRRALRKYGLK